MSYLFLVINRFRKVLNNNKIDENHLSLKRLEFNVTNNICLKFKHTDLRRLVEKLKEKYMEFYGIRYFIGLKNSKLGVSVFIEFFEDQYKKYSINLFNLTNPEFIFNPEE